MGYLRLHAIPERLAVALIHIRNCTLHYRSETVSLLDSLLNSFLPASLNSLIGTTVLITLKGNSTKFYYPGTHLITRYLIKHCKVCKHLLCHHAGSHNRKSKSAGEMSAATRILTVLPLEGRSKVRMSRTRHCREKAIVRRMRIGILEHNSQRCACRMSFKDAADNHRLIRLDTRCSTLCSALSAEDILHEILLRKLKSLGHTVQNHSNELSVRFTKDRYPEFSAYCIHICANIS